MSKTHFYPKLRPTTAPGFWSRRELHKQHQRIDDSEVAALFRKQAIALREQLSDLLVGGLSEGVETALSALAEEEMVDFCIMVDLAEPIELRGVEPLPEAQRAALAQFLDQEPWHSLAVDHDITIALALLDSIGVQPRQARWYRYAPGLFDLLARIFDQGNKEQFQRFVGEYRSLAERDHIRLSDDAQTMFNRLVNETAHRHGLGDQRL